MDRMAALEVRCCGVRWPGHCALWCIYSILFFFPVEAVDGNGVGSSALSDNLRGRFGGEVWMSVLGRLELSRRENVVGASGC